VLHSFLKGVVKDMDGAVALEGGQEWGPATHFGFLKAGSSRWLGWLRSPCECRRHFIVITSL